MPQGLRAADAPRIQELCKGDKRLLMRIGALLEKRLSVSEAVLEEIEYSTEIRKLLMDRQLAEANDEQLADLLSKHQCEDIGLLISAVDDEWRCLHLEDELNNIFATNEAENEDEQAQQAWAANSVSNLLPSLNPAVRTPVEGLLSAKGDDQRAAAIEQLRYAAPSLNVVSELLPMILADGADIVRERGISLLTASGASPVVTDLIRAMHNEDHKTLQRLCKHVSRLGSDQKELIFAALIANATRGTISNTSIAISCEMAEVIASHRGLERFLELLLLHGGEFGLVKFIRLLQEHNADGVDQILQAFSGQSDNTDAKILIFLAHPKAQFSEEMMRRGVAFLISDQDEPKDRMGLANALRRMNTATLLGQLLAEEAKHLHHTRDSTVFWLLAELSREQLIAENDANLIAEEIRLILRRADGPHTVAILDQQLPALIPCDEQQRERMVEPLAELLAKFRDDRSQDQINNTLHLIGKTGLEPLWRVITAHPKNNVRVACAAVLPGLFQERDDASALEAIERLRQASTDIHNEYDRGQFLLSAAKMLQHCSDGAELSQTIDRDCQSIGPQSIDAQAHLVASAHLGPDRRMDIVNYILQLISAELPDGESEESVDPATDEITYVLDTNLSMHTDLVPRALESLEIICRSEHLPQQLLRRISMALIAQWRKVSRWEIIWGPANIHQLAKTLSEIASHTAFPDSLRIQIAEALAPRANQIRIADYLIRVFSSSRSQRIADIAVRALKRIMKDCNDNQYAEDEYGDLVHILARYLLLKQLHEKHSNLLTQISHTIGIYQAQCTHRTRELLLQNKDKLQADVADRLDWLHS